MQGKYGENPSQQSLRLKSECLPVESGVTFSWAVGKNNVYLSVPEWALFLFKEVFMKKKLSILSILLVVVLALCAFIACGKGTAKVTVLENEEELLVIRADETKEDVSLEDVLKDLKKSGEIQYEISNGFITSVNGRNQDPGSGEYWFVYTSLTTYKGVTYSDTSWDTYSYDGTDYFSAVVGVDGLPMIEGNLYILALGTYNY